MAVKALTILASGILVDRAALISHSSDELQTIISTIRHNPDARLTVVDNAAGFFTAENLIAKIKAKNLDYKMIAEHANVVVNEDTIDAILKAEAAVNAINVLMKPKWNFALVPDGWSFATDVSFGVTQVRRKRLNTAGSTEYYLSPTQTEKLWGIASKRWANSKTAIDARFLANGQNRVLSVYTDRVAVGCQVIMRYELEQIASHKGWAFPELV